MQYYDYYSPKSHKIILYFAKKNSHFTFSINMKIAIISYNMEKDV